MDAATNGAGDSRPVWLFQYDTWLELFVIFNFGCLTGDILLAHSFNHFRNSAEYLPLYFSPVASVLLLIALLLRRRLGSSVAWKLLGQLAGWAAIVMGAAGVVFHLDSHFFYEHTLKSLTYTAPFAAPLAYIGLGCLTVMSRMVSFETREWGQWVLFFAAGGFAGNFVLSLADHATNAFFHWTEWIPVASSALAVGFLFAGLVSRPDARFWRVCQAVLLLQVLVGLLGFALHFSADLHGPSSRLFEDLVSGAPPFAPLLFPNLAVLAWIALCSRREEAVP